MARWVALLWVLLLGGCANPNQAALQKALGGLELQLAALEEELAAANGLHYQQASNAPLALRQHLVQRQQEPHLVEASLVDGPLLTYRWQVEQLPPLPTPCQSFEFELRHLGQNGQLQLIWQTEQQQTLHQLTQRQVECHYAKNTKGA